MTQQSTQTVMRPFLSTTAAQLFVADIGAACDFYTQKLGFSVVFVYGDAPFYAQVRRDRALLNLRCVDEPVIDAARRERESLLSAAIGVDSAAEIERLFADFQSAGIDFHKTLERQPWGARHFIVRDPDGNLVLFAGPTQ